jgi:hypothetical protein
MNLLSRFLAVGALLTSVQVFAAGTFEGKVTLAVTAGKGRAMTMDLSMKGQKQRMDMQAEGHQMATITDLAKLESIILMPDQGMYMVQSIKKPLEQAMGKAGENTADVEVTGKTETILGYKCNQILVKDKGTVIELWAAEGLGLFTGLGGGGPMGGNPFGGGRGGAGAAKWEAVLKEKGGFPLRVIARDGSFKMEATKIEPGALPDSLFSVPAGFQKLDMGGMMGFRPGGE